MVGVQHQRMARLEGERVFVFLLREHIIGGAELLDGGIVQAGTFLHLGSDEEPLALDLSHLRLDVPAAANGQGVGGYVAAVEPQHTGHRIPEGALTIPAISVVSISMNSPSCDLSWMKYSEQATTFQKLLA